MAYITETESFLQVRKAKPRAAAGSISSGAVKSRVYIAMLAFVGVYIAFGARLAMLAETIDVPQSVRLTEQDRISASRPDLIDRNGEILATDIKTASVFADARRIIDVNEAVDGLTRVLPDLDADILRRRLESRSAFVWLKRELTPEQARAVHDLGLPGIDFLTENQRFYPGGTTAGHIVGSVNIDNQGLTGIERHLDKDWLADLQAAGFTADRRMEPVKLAMDLRVQHVVRDEVAKAVELYKAIAGVGIVLNVHTGEVVAMSSLPDYDPNDRSQALEQIRMNRATGGVFEMGSVFKSFTVAMALDSGKVSINDSFDATKPIRAGGRTITDFHGKHRVLSVPEVFIYSSNIGTAKMMLATGVDAQKEFLGKLGLTSRLETELPENAAPLLPPKWNELAAMTISFGHGISVTPMQTAVATAALMNGGKLIPPTFFPRTEDEANALAKQVVSPQTSKAMRYLYRLNVVNAGGSGKRAEVPGYIVGGKTGTAEKIENGRYVSNKRRNSFLSAFPMDDPQYVVLVVLDEPKPEREGLPATAGMNAAPTVGAIIRRAAPMLGVMPRFSEGEEPIEISY
ncbi:peptidoglycan D,D-transpeptidase FtsI family protein [Roseibium aestuarii]|uniref:Peptidoglycan D,D-transpeptidase FtsI family protein n=1 Tax=Roseibium aestuarii TaxID=2600299 RepID=A0ABW4JZC0_9HYPH|nr:penicillin-binding protein 2 [Roseibium aestuarii]